ncbi:MAG: hypothetical protein O7H41_14390 [Planctomycetota bacterium]|nr:hypothetical protein [Planctomycetota bacterium]
MNHQGRLGRTDGSKGRVRIAALLTMGLVTLLPGCVKLKWLMTVYPGGSGKVEIRLRVTKAGHAFSKFAPPGEPSGKTLKPESIQAGSRGIVAWTETRESQDDGETVWDFTGYFEDLSQVKISMLCPRMKGWKSFDFRKQEDGSYELTFEDDAIEEIGDHGKHFDRAKGEQEKERVRQALRMSYADLEFEYTFRLPGEVEHADDMEIEGRNARLAVDADWLIEKMEKGVIDDEYVAQITSRPEEDIADEFSAFEKEMKEARKAWDKRKKADAPPEKKGEKDGRDGDEEGPGSKGSGSER